MKKLVLMGALLALTISANAGVKEIGTVNGLRIVRIKTVGIFAPSTTTIIAFDPNKPGTIEAVLNQVGGPGVVPAAANAGGLVGAAAVLRPARTETNVNASGGSGSATASGSGNATHTPPPATPGWIPPGHRE